MHALGPHKDPSRGPQRSGGLGLDKTLEEFTVLRGIVPPSNIRFFNYNQSIEGYLFSVVV